MDAERYQKPLKIALLLLENDIDLACFAALEA